MHLRLRFRREAWEDERPAASEEADTDATQDTDTDDFPVAEGGTEEGGAWSAPGAGLRPARRSLSSSCVSLSLSLSRERSRVAL